MGILERLGIRHATVPMPSMGGRVVRVMPGETLRSIAKREYGNEDAWLQIYETNRVRVNDAEALEIGTELRLP